MNIRLPIKSFALTAFGLLVFSFSIAQRYSQQVFDNTTQETVTYFTERKLEMDVYQPAGDVIPDRPLLIYVHGGGFSGGRRDEPFIAEFCKNLARRGYVVASLSYTLTMKGKSFSCDQPSKSKLATFRQAGEEINVATRYFLEHQDQFRINPNQIVLAGSSAGAEAIVHAAYWPETWKPLPAGFRYAGLISMAGAIYDLTLITKETAIPMMFFHGTCDNLVPYGTAPHHYCKDGDTGYLMLSGASAMAGRLQSLHIGYYLITGCNDGHEWNSRPLGEYQAEIAQFMLQDVMGKRFRQVHEIIRTGNSCRLTETPDVCSH